MNAAPSPINILRITDGKPGHENQTLGLVAALAKEMPVEVLDYAALPLGRALSAGLFLRPDIGRGIPAADLIICAGHATHITALAARRQMGGRIVVLMKPSLPLAWFDLCLIPEHDAISAENVITTRGAINAVARTDKQKDLGLILLGGPSQHAGWDDSAIGQQIQAIISRDPRRWLIASSRRTPDSTLQVIAPLELNGAEVVPWQTVGRDWLRQQLAVAATIWVSEDSVSMIYEALTSGASCGLIGLPRVKATRVARGIAQMVADGSLVYARDWLDGAPMPCATHPLNEAKRCARLIRSRWFANDSPG